MRLLITEAKRLSVLCVKAESVCVRLIARQKTVIGDECLSGIRVILRESSVR